MEKRMLMALVLSIGVVLIFSQFTSPPPTDESPEGTPTETEQSVDDGKQTTSDESTKGRQAELRDASETPTEPTQASQETDFEENNEEILDDAGETVAFETAELRGTISRRGARFKSLELRNFSQIEAETRPVNLIAEGGGGFAVENRYPVEGSASHVYQQLDSDDSDLLRFRTRDGPLSITKRYRLDKDRPNRISLEVSLKNQSAQPYSMDRIDFPAGKQGEGAFGLRWGPGFGINKSSENRLDKTYIYYGKNGDMEYMSPGGGGMLSWFSGDDDEDPYQFKRGPVEWIGISSRYFIATIIPKTRFDMMFVDARNGADTFTAWGAYGPMTLDPGEQRTYEFDLYLGHKEYNKLNEVHPGLESTMNYGWFTFLGRPMLWTLNFIYGFIPNYGIAIILLSILIKVLLYPLTKKGLTSMQKMRQLQPELKKLQEKYEDDKEKLNQKMMEFYQENNLNPLGGCLPILLQLPIFISLYRMLEYSIELRGAHFMLWVTDLSHKDPYYILPVVMGIIMFFQQKYTMTASPMGGSTGQQQKLMMYFMPAMFVFLFMNFPVGLVLYWMTNSLMTLVQYALIYRSLEED